jgi:uncharacterized protein with PIN domain
LLPLGCVNSEIVAAGLGGGWFERPDESVFKVRECHDVILILSERGIACRARFDARAILILA